MNEHLEASHHEELAGKKYGDLNTNDRSLQDIYAEFRRYTMVYPKTYIRNLVLAASVRYVSGAVVECGTWKGGMAAGLSRVMGEDRDYFLFDSFEGLPPAEAIDGDAALRWQQDTNSPHYHDNCTADERDAQEAMRLAGVTQVRLVKGWFEDTLPSFPSNQQVAVLRLDADWYESTIQCLNQLYPRVAPGGLILIDDYHTWDGCSKAVHDYLSQNQLADRIRQFQNDVAYIIKSPDLAKTERAQRIAGKIARLAERTDHLTIVDQGAFDRTKIPEEKVSYFFDRDGLDYGPAADDAAAIEELERAKQTGASHIVFTWCSFWWLEFYDGFRAHLTSRFRKVSEDFDLVVFQLTSQ